MRGIALMLVLVFLPGCRTFPKLTTLNLAVTVSPTLSLQGVPGAEVKVGVKH